MGDKSLYDDDESTQTAVGARYIAPAPSNANSADTMGDKSLFDDDERIQTAAGTRYAMKILSIISIDEPIRDLFPIEPT